ncbi:MAG: 5-formyltetrahydrofolate cyclo-ligase [Crocinitomicaceae bacterium]|nr:5-formyltetrahydrofolate cyclo-ligase [Crocinitomicaceae bacterium]
MTKKEVREKYGEKRRFIERNIVSLFSGKIREVLLENFDFEGKNVSLFTSLESKNEVNTWHFFNLSKVNVYAPVMKANNTLQHIQISDNTEWEENNWGIKEPVSGAQISPDKFDFVIVPLLAADKRGYRTGYGGGYYDRFLAQCPKNCVFIGVGFYDLIDEIEDVNEFDVPLHFYAQPEKLTKF